MGEEDFFEGLLVAFALVYLMVRLCITLLWLTYSYRDNVHVDSIWRQKASLSLELKQLENTQDTYFRLLKSIRKWFFLENLCFQLWNGYYQWSTMKFFSALIKFAGIPDVFRVVTPFGTTTKWMRVDHASFIKQRIGLRLVTDITLHYRMRLDNFISFKDKLNEEKEKERLAKQLSQCSSEADVENFFDDMNYDQPIQHSDPNCSFITRFQTTVQSLSAEDLETIVHWEFELEHRDLTDAMKEWINVENIVKRQFTRFPILELTSITYWINSEHVSNFQKKLDSCLPSLSGNESELHHWAFIMMQNRYNKHLRQRNEQSEKIMERHALRIILVKQNEENHVVFLDSKLCSCQLAEEVMDWKVVTELGEDDSDGGNDRKCGMCCETADASYSKLTCGHVYHSVCILDFFCDKEPRCPLCHERPKRIDFL